MDDKITEYRVRRTERCEDRAKVQIGAELGRRVQRCKSAGGLCEGGKVEARGQSTEYRLQRRQQRGMVGWSIEYRGMPKRKGDSAKVSASRARRKGAKVEIGRRPVQKCKGG